MFYQVLGLNFKHKSSLCMAFLKSVFVYISIQAREHRHKKLSGTPGWIRISPVILQIMRFGVKVGQVIPHCGLSYALLPVNTRGHCSFRPLEPQAVLHTQLFRPKPQIHSWFLFSSTDKSNPSARPSGLIHSTPRTHSIPITSLYRPLYPHCHLLSPATP